MNFRLIILIFLSISEPGHDHKKILESDFKAVAQIWLVPLKLY